MIISGYNDPIVLTVPRFVLERSALALRAERDVIRAQQVAHEAKWAKARSIARWARRDKELDRQLFMLDEALDPLERALAMPA